MCAGQQQQQHNATSSEGNEFGGGNGRGVVGEEETSQRMSEEQRERQRLQAEARKRRRGESKGGAYVRTPAEETEAGRRRERRGVVTSNKSEQTITVRVDVLKAHPKYKKIMRRSMTLHAHDEKNAANIGDTVRVVETRPLSRTKHWRLVEIVEVAK